ncbi:MAG: DUF2851 family protein [Kiritimatiellae bacterium]|nr:DUF2851 family protein [Kiritimatiellia bacterium]
MKSRVWQCGPVSERHVQAIWYDAALRPDRLLTRRGCEVHVASPGEWNLGPGPDFLGAVLELGPERRRVVGDVEVHLCPADWDMHGHGADPKYRNVVAHVTWGCGPSPSTLPLGAVSIWLGRFVTSDTSFSPDKIDLGVYPFARLPIGERPCEESLGHDPDRAREVLSAAGKRRLRMKSLRICGRLGEATAEPARSGGRRQVFYEEIMTALGYSRNGQSFRRVARRVPLDELPKEPQAARNAFLAAGSFEQWDLTSSRPSNLPEVRLSRAAEMFTCTPVMEMSETSDFSRAACREMVSAMCADGTGDGGAGRIVGRGRAAAVIANVVAPFALAEERLSAPPDWLPPEDISAPVRLTAFRLFGRDHNPAAFYSTNGLLIQGLLQIYNDCCLRYHPECGDCGLANMPSEKPLGFGGGNML